MLNLDGLRSFHSQGTSLGVVGFPIAHSLSPVFQNAALQALAKDDPIYSDWEYLKIEAPVEQLPEVIELGRAKGFRGLNLTIPHKVEVLRYVDRVDPVAAKMGAVNTLVFHEDGVAGHNTDGCGISAAVNTELGITITGRPIVLLGAGGAARAICVQCLEEGCSELWVGNRSQARLQELLARLTADYPEATIRGFELGGDAPTVSEESLLINATSLGLKPNDPMPVSRDMLEAVGYVYDIVYGSKITPLVKAARDAGKPAADGLSMLIFQGRESLILWTGRQPSVEVMREAILKFTDH